MPKRKREWQPPSVKIITGDAEIDLRAWTDRYVAEILKRGSDRTPAEGSLKWRPGDGPLILDDWEVENPRRYGHPPRPPAQS